MRFVWLGTSYSPHQAERHELDLRESALLGKQLAEFLFGDVIQDHLPVQRSGNQVRADHGRVDGLEDAVRPHERCAFESFPHFRNKKAPSFAFAEGLGLACSYALKA
jgi:hypothetical protein